VHLAGGEGERIVARPVQGVSSEQSRREKSGACRANRKNTDEIGHKHANSVLPQIVGSLHSAVSVLSFQPRRKIPIVVPSGSIRVIDKLVVDGERNWSRLLIRISLKGAGSAVANAASVAQLVEQLICNQPVVGSSPSAGSCSRQRDVTLRRGHPR